MEYTPHLFVGVGENYHFFTLRQTYLHTVYTGGEGEMGNAVVNGQYMGSAHTEERSFHMYNLSQDADEAMAKASEAAQELGMEIRASREIIELKMHDIRRATEAEKDRRAREAAEREQLWAAERKRRDDSKLDQISSGVYPFGAHAGKRFEEAPVSYVNWMIKSADEFEAGSVMKALGEAVKASPACQAMLLPTPDASAFLGEEKKRITVDVICVGSAHFYSNFGAPQRVNVITMMDKASRARLVCMSSAFYAEAGEEFKIKATVKEHALYNGLAQTIVQRIAILEEETQ